MAWQILNPNVRLVIWPGPYRDCAPTESADDPLADVQVKEQTEFSVQCYSDDKPIGPGSSFRAGSNVGRCLEGPCRLSRGLMTIQRILNRTTESNA